VESQRHRRLIGALNKIDLLDPVERRRRLESARSELDIPWVALSTVTGEGLHDLEDAIACAVAGEWLEPESVVVTNARHLHAIGLARESVGHALQTAADRLPPDLISIDLRGALDALGRITGETATEEIIHRIFHDFCVGK
jgi:tRNA modification GTPase